jgi:hypothetical protein
MHIGERLADHILACRADSLQHLHIGFRDPAVLVEQADIPIVRIDDLTEAFLAPPQHHFTAVSVGGGAPERCPNLRQFRHARFEPDVGI